MPPMRPVWVVVGIDPGETTGLALATLYKETSGAQAGSQAEGVQPDQTHTHPLIQGFHVEVREWTDASFDDAVPKLRAVIRQARRLAYAHNLPMSRVAVTVERFILTRTAVMGNATWSSEVTGMAKALAAVDTPGYHWDRTQSAADMKTTVHQAKALQQMGLIKRGAKISTHMADALGHVILFAARYRNGEFPAR